jgi:HrpA-like RNA helicase
MENKVFKCIIEEILEDRSTIRNKYKGHVLTFCTGVDEINKLCDRMRNYLNLAHFIVVGLHGKLTAEEQRLAFSDTPNQCKFIFASRIAETAITIDNVKVVIDPGQDRENVYDQKKKISSFQMKPISRSAAKQRAGRAGRTSAGYCFRLYDLNFEKDSMPANKTPEIESVPLDIIVLRLKALKIENLLDFPYLSKPKEDSISASVESMQLIGCLDYRQEITPIGRNIVRIPIEPLLSRAIIDAILLEKLDRSRKVLSRVIKVLAIIANSQSIFYSNEDTREICETAKFNEFAEESGDFFSLLNVYTAFEHALSMGKDRAACFIRERFLNKKSLFQCRELVREINAIVELIQVNNLKDFGGYVDDLKQRLKKYPSDNELILSCLLTSFCQNLCLYSGDSQVGYTLFASKLPLQVYGSSFIALQGLTPRWIVCYDIIKTSATFCRIAQEVDFEMLKSCVSQQMFEKYQLAECEKFNPFYVSLERLVPTVVMKHLQQKQWEGDQNMPWLYDNSLVFDRDRNKVRLFVLQENSRYLR